MPPLVFGGIKMPCIFSGGRDGSGVCAVAVLCLTMFHVSILWSKKISKKICMVFALTGSRRRSRVKILAA